MTEDDVFEILRRLESGIQDSSIRYVYYSESTGNVLAIRNYIESGDELPYIEVDESELEKDRNLTDYKVIERQGQFILIKLDIEWPKFNVNDDIHKIEKINQIDEDYDLLIRQDNYDKKFCFIISNELIEKLSRLRSNEREIVAYVTAENDPNILYLTVRFKANKLIEDKKIYIDFSGYDGDIPCSIYTKRIFENYKHLDSR
jgi:hypothetical protein